MTEHSKAETIRNFDSNADQPKSEPMARAPSNDKSCSTPSPPPSEQRVYTPPSPNVGARRATTGSDSPPLSPVRSPQGSPTVEKLGVRFMNSRGPVDKDGGRNGRPAVYRSSFSNTELSTIDLKWGRLFDGDLNPTPRLRQFLRGLANHIVSFALLYYYTNFQEAVLVVFPLITSIAIILNVGRVDYISVGQHHMLRPYSGVVNWQLFGVLRSALSICAWFS